MFLSALYLASLPENQINHGRVIDFRFRAAMVWIASLDILGFDKSDLKLI
jgi:hypothetical protein